MAKWNKKKSKKQAQQTQGKSFVNILRENVAYETLLESAKSPEEKRFVKAYTEEVMKNFQTVYNTLQEAIEKDPDAVRKILSEITLYT